VLRIACNRPTLWEVLLPVEALVPTARGDHRPGLRPSIGRHRYASSRDRTRSGAPAKAKPGRTRGHRPSRQLRRTGVMADRFRRPDRCPETTTRLAPDHYLWETGGPVSMWPLNSRLIVSTILLTSRFTLPIQIRLRTYGLLTVLWTERAFAWVGGLNGLACHGLGHTVGLRHNTHAT
jgi:hypothetical protein